MYAQTYLYCIALLCSNNVGSLYYYETIKNFRQVIIIILLILKVARKWFPYFTSLLRPFQLIMEWLNKRFNFFEDPFTLSLQFMYKFYIFFMYDYCLACIWQFPSCLLHPRCCVIISSSSSTNKKNDFRYTKCVTQNIKTLLIQNPDIIILPKILYIMSSSLNKDTLSNQPTYLSLKCFN